MCISHNTASSFLCHMCRLEFKMPLPPVKKQKTLACIREIQVHKYWTKVYSQKGLTAMVLIYTKLRQNIQDIDIQKKDSRCNSIHVKNVLKQTILSFFIYF